MDKAIKILAVIAAAMVIFLAIMVMMADAEYVISPEGLNVRTEQGTDSELLEVIPFAGEVL